MFVSESKQTPIIIVIIITLRKVLSKISNKFHKKILTFFLFQYILSKVVHPDFYRKFLGNPKFLIRSDNKTHYGCLQLI